jgi:hypothetical protein
MALFRSPCRVPSLHQQHRLWLSTTTTNTTTAGSAMKRQNKKPATRNPTVKDRLRSRLDRPSTKKNAMDADLIAERVTTRLEWARESVTAFWKDSTGTTKTGTGTRPQRYDLQMNTSWWFWNLLLAASPALMIALYCEAIAKPQMIFQQEAQQQAESDEAGLAVPPTRPVVSESMTHISDWLQSKLLGRALPERSTETTLPEQSKQTNTPPSLSTTPQQQQQQQQEHHQQLEQLQTLKRQLNALEEQLSLNSQQPRSATAHAQSGVRQRMMERQQSITQKDQAQEAQQAASAPSPTIFSAVLHSAQAQMKSYWYDSTSHTTTNNTTNNHNTKEEYAPIPTPPPPPSIEEKKKWQEEKVRTAAAATVVLVATETANDGKPIQQDQSTPPAKDDNSQNHPRRWWNVW